MITMGITDQGITEKKKAIKRKGVSLVKELLTLLHNDINIISYMLFIG